MGFSGKLTIRNQLMASFTAAILATLLLMAVFATITVTEGVDEVTKLNLHLSESVLTTMGENLVKAEAHSVSNELARLLVNQPQGDYAALRANYTLRKVATKDIITKFGKAGYVDMYDKTGVSVLHPNRDVEGHNFKEYADQYPEMWNLVQVSFHVPETSGYYSFLDKDGKPQRKFMAMSHVRGTNFVVVAAVGIDAYFKPVQEKIYQASQATRAEALDDVWKVLVMGFVGAVALGLLCAVWFSGHISRPIKELVRGVGAVGEGDFQVRVRGEGCLEISELAGAFNNLGAELADYMERLKAETAARQAAASEMKIARQIQESLLPSTFPPFPEKRNMQLFAVNQPAKEVAGDFYDFFLVGDERLALVMGDVSGKGVPAALFMTMTRTLLRNICPEEPSPAKALAKANELLCQDNSASMFVTLFLIYYNMDSGEMLFANAGHNDPFIIDSQGGVRPFGRLGDIALGAMGGLSYDQGRETLNLNESLALYTDGITEAPSPENEEFGEGRFEQLLAQTTGQPLEDICRRVVDEVNQFQHGDRFDDVTLMLVRRL